MPTIRNFEDIQAWQEARKLANHVYDLIEITSLRRDYGLSDQIRRAAGSAMQNIAEGFDAGSPTEFIRFLRYARRSTSEVQSQLYLAFDRAYMDRAQFQTVYDQATSVKKLINAFIRYLKTNNA